MGFVMRVKLTETLRDGTLKNYYENKRKAGYQFDLRLAYYRGHYLSVIDELAVEAVSYTHLDVYKRQGLRMRPRC